MQTTPPLFCFWYRIIEASWAMRSQFSRTGIPIFKTLLFLLIMFPFRGHHSLHHIQIPSLPSTIMFIHSSNSFLLAGCAAISTIVSAQSIKWVNCSQNVPDPATYLNVTGVDLNALPKTLHCGRITVPVDYSQPLGTSNNITLGLAMYRPEKPKGVIFL